MKKIIALTVALVLVLSIGAIASASIYGGVEERAALVEANKGAHQAQGDRGGKFTAALNRTQPIYAAAGITDFYALGDAGVISPFNIKPLAST